MPRRPPLWVIGFTQLAEEGRWPTDRRWERVARGFLVRLGRA